jgi:hypothetical protein
MCLICKNGKTLSERRVNLCQFIFKYCVCVFIVLQTNEPAACGHSGRVNGFISNWILDETKLPEVARTRSNNVTLSSNETLRLTA